MQGEPPNEDEDTSTIGKSADSDKTYPSAKAHTKTQSNLTEVGGQKKRKQVKVVGDDAREKAETDTAVEDAKPKQSASRKPKKAKKIKLSFDEE